jgi:hypothetical protein
MTKPIFRNIKFAEDGSRFNGKDITGNKFNRLLAIKPLRKNKYNNWIWEFICDCGKIYQSFISPVLSGNVKSCSCLRLESCIKSRRLPDGEAAFNLLYSGYRTDARKMNREFNLSKNEFKILTSSNCNYCGHVPSKIQKVQSKITGVYIYNGIDRVDNSKEYILSNCVSCCTFCNFIKQGKSYEYFLNKINKIYNLHANVKFVI